MSEVALSDRLRGWTRRSRRLSLLTNALGFLALVIVAADPSANLPRTVAYAVSTLVIINSLVLVAQWGFTRARLDSARPAPLALTVTAMVSLGLLFGAAMVTSAAVWRVTLALPAVWLIVTAGVVVPWWMITLELSRYTRRSAGLRRDELSRRRHTTISVAREEAQYARGLHSALAGQHRAQIDALARRLDTLSGTLPPESLACAVEDIAVGDIRRLSHTLWDVDPKTDLRPSFRQVIITIWRRRPFRPIMVALLYLLVDLPGYIDGYGVDTAVVGAVIGVAGILIVLGGANAIMRRYPSQHAMVFTAAIVLLQLPQPIWGVVTGGYLGRPWSPWEYALSVPLSVAIIVATAGFGAWRESAEHLMDAYSAELDRDEAEAVVRAVVIADATRDLARRLHGPVHARLLAIAQRIRDATDDPSALEEAFQEARSTLDIDLIVASQETSGASLPDVLEKICRPWQDLLQVRWQVDPRFDAPLDASVADSLHTVIGEAIGNAHRHGLAEHVDIRVRPTGHVLEILIVDDGTPTDDVYPGLGSRLIDQATSGNWDRHADSRGTRLTASIPTG